MGQMYGQSDDGLVNVSVDSITGGVVTIPVEHHEIHEGEAFSLSGYLTMADNKVGAIAITPAVATAAAVTFNMTAATSDLTYTAQVAGEEGNDISVRHLADPDGATASSVSVDGKDITVYLKTDGGAKSTKAIGGVTYTAVDTGVAGDDITVAHTSTLYGQPLTVDVEDSAITVGLANSGGTDAYRTLGGIVWTSNLMGTLGNAVTITMLGGTSKTLAVAVDGTDVTVQLGTDSGGAVTSTAAGVSDAVKALPAANALVRAARTGTVSAVSKTALTGGAFTITSTEVEVAAAIAANADARALVTAVPVTGTTTKAVAAAATNLANGAAPAIAADCTAASIKTLVNADAAASALVACEDEGSGTGVVNKLPASGHTHLTGGKDTKYVHLKDMGFGATTGPVYVVLNENRTFTGGDAATPVNQNRNSTEVSNCTCKTLNDATLSDGTSPLTIKTMLIPAAATGANKTPATAASGYEFILKPGSTYVVSLDNNPNTAASTVGYDLFWYEEQ